MIRRFSRIGAAHSALSSLVGVLLGTGFFLVLFGLGGCSMIPGVGAAQQAAAVLQPSTSDPEPASSSTSTSDEQTTTEATAQDEGIVVNVGSAGGDVIITVGGEPVPPVEAMAEAENDLPPADPLRAVICEYEGRTPTTYHDGAAYHIACGHQLDDGEIDALRDEDLEQAATEARRLLGSRLDDMAPARRDALYWLCYAAACAGFSEVLDAVRGEQWDTAADEVMDSRFATDPEFPGRYSVAEHIATWLREGEYGIE